MIFNSFEFLIFLPIVVSVYFLLPKKYTWVWLLISSYYFYMSWNPAYAILIMLSTGITYLSGILIHKANRNPNVKISSRNKRIYVGLSFGINLLILGFFKYYNFFAVSLMSILGNTSIFTNIPLSSMLLPVGISFYTFQALSYTMDVYRGDIDAEYHFGHYALFVSFFPQLVAGPIEKSKNLLPQVKRGKTLSYQNIRAGLITIGWGLVKKVVIADRLAVVVNTVYNNVNEYTGIYLIVATIFFAFQIYCDFSGYSDIAIGCAKIMGYDLMINFRQPYFSKTIREFWQRWHISLSTWFKEYLYIPLGGNRVSWIRNAVNLLIVFIVSGLWHGANWTFIVWGLLHGIYQLVANITRRVRHNVREILHINETTAGYSFFSTLITFALVCFAWIFFRANNYNDAIYVIRNLSLKGFHVFFTEGYSTLGLDKSDFILGIIGILILLVIDSKITDENLAQVLEKENLPLRWTVYFAIIFFIIIFGYYGGGNATNFIYFQF